MAESTGIYARIRDFFQSEGGRAVTLEELKNLSDKDKQELLELLPTAA